MAKLFASRLDEGDTIDQDGTSYPVLIHRDHLVAYDRDFVWAGGVGEKLGASCVLFELL